MFLNEEICIYFQTEGKGPVTWEILKEKIGDLEKGPERREEVG